ncbi:MAG: RNA polymerase sigma factor [Patescibacteria group bacterium]|nr:RNA polymerase sigma factor [Patescibacteria group bacterium]
MTNFEDFYNQQVDRIFNFCYYKTGNRFLAEDLTSETFLRFLKSRRLRLDKPVAYLYQISRNLIIDHYRKHKEQSLETMQENGLEISLKPNFEKMVLVKEALEEIKKLPEEQMDVLLMQYVQDLDNQTIAKALGKSESAIKSLAHRGLETLRKKLNKETKNE